jgi:hypothetical protein
MKKLALAVLSAALVASGCIVQDHDDFHGGNIGPGPTDRFDLQFDISFEGATCGATPTVDRVRLRLEGPAVADETVLCPPEGGRVFTAIPAGTYTWRIDGLAPDDTVLYTATGIVDLNQDLVVDATLIPVGGPTLGTLTFFWTFAGQNCATAGVAQVRVTIPGLFDEAVACATQGVEGISIDNLPAGATPWTLAGQDAGGAALFQAIGSSTVEAGAEVQTNVDLAAVGAGG